MDASLANGPASELLAGLVALGDSLPFNQHLGARVDTLEVGHAVTRLADHARLHNHLGGVHAIAELAPVELAGALAASTRLWQVLERGYVPVLGEVTARYVAPAAGELTATARLGSEAVAPALASVEAGERPRAEVDVAVTDPHGTVVLEAQLTFVFLDAASRAAELRGS